MSFALCIDTSFRQTFVAITEHGKSIAEVAGSSEESAENVFLLIADALKQSGLKKEQLQLLAVARGPGSFTGLRCGLGAATGLCCGMQIPLVAVPSLLSATIPYLSGNSFYAPWTKPSPSDEFVSLYYATKLSNGAWGMEVITEAALVALGARETFLAEQMQKYTEAKKASSDAKLTSFEITLDALKGNPAANVGAAVEIQTATEPRRPLLPRMDWQTVLAEFDGAVSPLYVKAARAMTLQERGLGAQ